MIGRPETFSHSCQKTASARKEKATRKQDGLVKGKLEKVRRGRRKRMKKMCGKVKEKTRLG